MTRLQTNNSRQHLPPLSFPLFIFPSFLASVKDYPYF
jgi:hypothetical protein